MVIGAGVAIISTAFAMPSAIASMTCRPTVNGVMITISGDGGCVYVSVIAETVVADAGAGARRSTPARWSGRRPVPSPHSQRTGSRAPQENRALKISRGIAKNADCYRAGTVGTAVVFGQQPSGLMCASRAASRHLLTRTFGSSDTEAARISLARASASAVSTLFGHPGIGLLDVQRVDTRLGGFVVIHQRHNHLDDLDLCADLARNFSATSSPSACTFAPSEFSGASGAKSENTSFRAALSSRVTRLSRTFSKSP